MKNIIILSLILSLSLAQFLPIDHSKQTSLEDDLNTNVVIGIFTEPSPYNNTYPSDKYSYIAASYVKNMEMAGARVIPVPYDAPISELEKILQGVNGIVFPGGDVEFEKNGKKTLFAASADYIFQRAISMSKNGDHFPILGTCLGFELIHYLVAQNMTVLRPVTDESHQNRPLILAKHDTRFFNSFPDDLHQYLQTNNSLHFNHEQCVDDQSYVDFPELGKFFDRSSYASNHKDKVFVSSVEAFDYPIYGNQYHPEKNMFEWKFDIPHDEMSIRVAQHHANFFVEEARKSQHQFSTEELNRRVIYNYNATQIDSTIGESGFMQVYMMKNFKSQELVD